MNKSKPEVLPRVSLVIAVALVEISSLHLLSAEKKSTVYLFKFSLISLRTHIYNKIKDYFSLISQLYMYLSECWVVKMSLSHRTFLAERTMEEQRRKL